MSFLESSFPLISGREKSRLWGQQFQACAIDADCAMKPDGQNSVISFVISKWLLRVSHFLTAGQGEQSSTSLHLRMFLMLVFMR